MAQGPVAIALLSLYMVITLLLHIIHIVALRHHKRNLQLAIRLPDGIRCELALSSFISINIVLFQISIIQGWDYPCPLIRLASFLDISFVMIFFAKSVFYCALLDPVMRKELYDVFTPHIMKYFSLLGVIVMIIIWAAFLPVKPCIHLCRERCFFQSDWLLLLPIRMICDAFLAKIVNRVNALNEKMQYTNLKFETMWSSRAAMATTPFIFVFAILIDVGAMDVNKGIWGIAIFGLLHKSLIFISGIMLPALVYSFSPFNVLADCLQSVRGSMNDNVSERLITLHTNAKLGRGPTSNRLNPNEGQSLTEDDKKSSLASHVRFQIKRVSTQTGSMLRSSGNNKSVLPYYVTRDSLRSEINEHLRLDDLLSLMVVRSKFVKFCGRYKVEKPARFLVDCVNFKEEIVEDDARELCYVMLETYFDDASSSFLALPQDIIQQTVERARGYLDASFSPTYAQDNYGRSDVFTVAYECIKPKVEAVLPAYKLTSEYQEIMGFLAVGQQLMGPDEDEEGVVDPGPSSPKKVNQGPGRFPFLMSTSSKVMPRPEHPLAKEVIRRHSVDSNTPLTSGVTSISRPISPKAWDQDDSSSSSSSSDPDSSLQLSPSMGEVGRYSPKPPDKDRGTPPSTTFTPDAS